MSPRRRILMLGTAAAVLVAVLAVVVVRLAGVGSSARSDPARAGQARPDQARPGPVLLVPGYGGGKAALTRLAGRLSAGGRIAKVITLPGDGTGDLRVQSDALDRAVRTELSGGAPSVDIVGYSAGGVVARLWVDRHDGAAVARRVVTLGSPLHGTRIAGEGAAFLPGACPQACRQLAPGSDVLRLIGAEPLPDGLPWLSVWTEDDETVQPPDSARLDGAVNVPVQSICPGARVAHGDLPTDPAVAALVVEALGTAPLSVPAGCPTG